jgi:prevent-host-death family protein
LPGRVAVALLFANGGAADLTFAALLDMVLDMTTITMRELMHNPTGVLRIVEHGGTVRLTRRGRPVARLVPEPKPTPRKVEWPDIMARVKSYCGDVVLTEKDMKRMKDEEERDFS